MKNKKKGFFSEVAGILQNKDNTVNPAIFNDALALEIDWQPLQPQGESIMTHELTAVSGHRLQFMPTSGLYVFTGFLIIFGLIFLTFGALTGFNLMPYVNNSNLPEPLPSILFIAMGSLILYYSISRIRKYFAPMVFDDQEGYFWRGKEMPKWHERHDEDDFSIPFSRIHAIQILSEYVSARHSYHSYEINLVLKNGSRVPLIDHSVKRSIISDAERLGRFIGVPVWSAI